MKLKVKGFRRPFLISVSSRGHIVCLSKSPKKKLYIFHPNSKEISINLVSLGIKDSSFLAINEKDEVIILDDISSTIKWFDLELNETSALNIPGSSYGSMKFEKTSNKLYVSVLDLSIIIEIHSDKQHISNFFDYSSIVDCKNANGIAIKDNRLLLLDSGQAELFDINIFDGQFECKKHLQYGRDGQGKMRNPSDVNFLDEYIVVNDYHNYLLQFFDEDLNFKYQLGGKGEGINQFDLPISGYAKKNEIYICDQNNDRVVLFNSNSKSFDVIIKDVFVEGYLRRPAGIAIGRNKRLYVADRSNGVIQIFDENLNFIEVLALDSGQLHRPSSIAVFEINDENHIAIIERKSGSDSSLNFYAPSENNKTLILTAQFKCANALKDPQDMCASDSGYIYVADTLNRRILQISIEGKLENQVDMSEISGNTRILVKTVFVKDGNVFTADFDKCIVYQFDYKLQIKNKIDFSTLKDSIEVIRGVYATNDYLILCVRGKNELLMTDFNGEILKVLDSKTKTGINWNHPVKICDAKNDIIFIADKENDRIVKFDKHLDLIPCTTRGFN